MCFNTFTKQFLYFWSEHFEHFNFFRFYIWSDRPSTTGVFIYENHEVGKSSSWLWFTYIHMYHYQCLCGMFSFLIWMEISNPLSMRQYSICHMIHNQMILSCQTCVTYLHVCHWCDLGNYARDRKNSDFLISVFQYLYHINTWREASICFFSCPSMIQGILVYYVSSSVSIL